MPPLLIAIDEEDSVFPHDRGDPQEMVSFRVNGKFKNKIPGIAEVNSENGKPKIEVSGQLPPDTYDVRLQASPNSKSPPTISQFNDEISYTSSIPNFPGFDGDEEDELPTILTGIGVAEPVLESELGNSINSITRSHYRKYVKFNSSFIFVLCL